MSPSAEQRSTEARFSRIATSAPWCCASPPHDDPRPVDSRSGQLVEKEIDSGNPPVTGNEEVRPGVSRRLTRAARYPWDPPGIAQLLGLVKKSNAPVTSSGSPIRLMACCS